MTRLTRKVNYDGIHYGSPNGIPCDNLEHLEKVYTKLGQLEDIESNLGIDLVKLLNTRQCYCKCDVDTTQLDANGEVSYVLLRNHIVLLNKFAVCIDSKKILCGSPNNCRTYYLRDYGKTWAFTKEELEK